MARRRTFTSDVFKIARSANRLRKSLNDLSDTLESSASSHVRAAQRQKPKAGMLNAVYEAQMREMHGETIQRIFYKKLVGVSFANDDRSSRKRAIRRLRDFQELRLQPQPNNPHDPDAIFVTTENGDGLGYLDKRLAGEVTRSLVKGTTWACYVRRLLTTPGTDHCGLVVCLVRFKKNAFKSVELYKREESAPPKTADLSIGRRFLRWLQG